MQLRAEQDVEPKAWTQEALADGVEKAMRAFDQVEFAADVKERRDANAFRPNQPQVMAEGEGGFRFVTDGVRWLIDERSFTTRAGSSEINPRHTVAGFNGDYHFDWDDRAFTIGVEESGKTRLGPQNVFWHAARSPEFLIRFLRRDESKVVGSQKVDGQLEVTVEGSWIDSVGPWNMRCTIAPERGFLVLNCSIKYKGQLDGEFNATDLAMTESKVWYPQHVVVRRFQGADLYREREVQVTKLEVPGGIRDALYEVAIPAGVDVVDFRHGYAWHKDPWWEDLSPMLREKFDWPRADLRALSDVASHMDASMEGKPAPPIQGKVWLNGKPGDWDRPSRKLTVVYFFGGRSIMPHPRWVASLRELARRYKPLGVDFVGVATSSSTPDMTVRSIKELKIEFPVAVDRASDGGFGQTFQAYKLDHYACVVLVDSEGMLRFVKRERHELEPGQNALEQVIKTELGKLNIEVPEKSIPERLTDDLIKQVSADWKVRRGLDEGQSTISGMVTSGDKPVANASVRLMPRLQLLYSNTPGGWHVIEDRQNVMDVFSDEQGKYSAAGLRKGRYQLTFSHGGMGRVTRDVFLATDDARQELNVTLPTLGVIAGQVVDKDGAAIPQATIKAVRRHLHPDQPRRWTTAKLPRRPVRTKENGRFRLGGLYEGSHTLEVTAEGFSTQLVELVPLGTRDLKVVLERPELCDVADDDEPLDPGTLFELKVVDRENGDPIKKFVVLPGVPYNGTKPDNIAVWQPHLIREAKDGKFVWSRERSYRSFRLRIESPGKKTVQTEWLHRTAEPRRITIQLESDPGLSGKLIGPDGRPVSGASIALPMPNRTVQIEKGKIKRYPRGDKLSDQWRQPLVKTTDDEGRFKLPTEPDRMPILCVHDQGFADLTFEDLRKSPTVKLQPWGKIDGRVEWMGAYGVNEKLWLSANRDYDVYPGMLSHSVTLQADDRGKFVIGHVPPGRVQMSREFEVENGDSKGSYLFPTMLFEVKAGDLTRIKFGGNGRPVTGRLTGLDSYDEIVVGFAPNAPRPADTFGWRAHQLIRQSKLGPVFFREGLKVKKDGTFRIESVLPAYYQLFVRSKDKSVHRVKAFSVPSMPDGGTDEPLDIGEIKLK